VAAQKSQYAVAKVRSDLAAKAKADADAALGEVSAIRGQAEQAALAACERAQTIVSDPTAPDAQAKLAEARAKRAEAEQAVARTGNALNTIRTSHALAQSAATAAAAAPDLAGELAALKARLGTLNTVPAALRAKGGESTAALNAAVALEKSVQSAADEWNKALAPFIVETGGQKKLPEKLRDAVMNYQPRYEKATATSYTAKEEKSCAPAFESAAAAIEGKLATATATLGVVEAEIKSMGAPPAPTDHAAEIGAIFNTARAAGDAIAAVATRAVTCVAVADAQIRNQAGADATALDAKKKECAAQFGRASAVWSPAQKQATCVCEAGHSFTNDKSKCVSEAEFATLANGECARRIRGGISTNRNARAQSYDCGCRSGFVLSSNGGSCVDVSTFNVQAAQQCSAKLPGSVVTSADPRTGAIDCGCPADLYQSRSQKRCVTRTEAVQIAAGLCAAQYPGMTVIAESFNFQTGAYKCQCNPGLIMTAGNTACVDQAQAAAMNNAACEQKVPNSVAQYNSGTGQLDCFCKPGFSLYGANQCVNVNDFKTQAVNACRTQYPNSVLASLEVSSGNYTCGCSFGFVWNGSGCQLMDFTPPVSGGHKPAPQKKCHRNPTTGQQHCM
jgi:hypothetical protein